MTNKELFLETAIGISQKLIDSAIWIKNKCTWNIVTQDKENPELKKNKHELAKGAIYQGSAGIALFLIELFKITKDNKILKTAEGAINFAIEDGLGMPNNSFGFHSGRVGIAYSTTLFAIATGKREYFNIAEELLSPLKDNIDNENGLDVIGGAAGAIPILLILSDYLNIELTKYIAEGLGKNLIKKANMEPNGWSWGSGTSNVRNLCGLAHGAAGFGHSFLELYNKTGKSKYLYACEQAFLYERQFYNEQIKNWPDFRYSDLSEYIYYNKIEELINIIKEDKLKPYQIKYMSAWCHGAPGIGLTRLRMFDITKNDIYKNESINAIEGTLNDCHQKLGNYSLCHGIGGNTETLIYAYEILNNKNYLNIAEKYGLEGIEKFANQNIDWPCGTIGSVSDPSLMLGEAGIGYFYLRLYDSTIPSVLLPTSSLIKKHNKEKELSYKNLQKDYIGFFFNKTLNAIQKETNYSIQLTNKIRIGDSTSDVALVIQKLKNNIINNDEISEITNETFLHEKNRYELFLNNLNYSQEYTEELRREPFESLDLEEIIIQLKPSTKVYEYNWNWEKWIENSNDSKLIDLKESNYKLLFKNKNKIHSKNLNTLSYLIFSSIQKQRTINQILEEILEMIDIQNVEDVAKLKTRIIEQICEAYNASILSINNNIIKQKEVIEVTN